jgi:hypothetical protein
LKKTPARKNRSFKPANSSESYIGAHTGANVQQLRGSKYPAPPLAAYAIQDLSIGRCGAFRHDLFDTRNIHYLCQNKIHFAAERRVSSECRTPAELFSQAERAVGSPLARYSYDLVIAALPTPGPRTTGINYCRCQPRRGTQIDGNLQVFERRG